MVAEGVPTKRKPNHVSDLSYLVKKDISRLDERDIQQITHLCDAVIRGHFYYNLRSEYEDLLQVGILAVLTTLSETCFDLVKYPKINNYLYGIIRGEMLMYLYHSRRLVYVDEVIGEDLSCSIEFELSYDFINNFFFNSYIVRKVHEIDRCILFIRFCNRLSSFVKFSEGVISGLKNFYCKYLQSFSVYNLSQDSFYRLLDLEHVLSFYCLSNNFMEVDSLGVPLNVVNFLMDETQVRYPAGLGRVESLGSNVFIMSNRELSSAVEVMFCQVVQSYLDVKETEY